MRLEACCHRPDALHCTGWRAIPKAPGAEPSLGFVEQIQFGPRQRSLPPMSGPEPSCLFKDVLPGVDRNEYLDPSQFGAAPTERYFAIRSRAAIDLLPVTFLYHGYRSRTS